MFQVSWKGLATDIAIESLKDYIQTPQANIEELLDYARINRVERIMRPYLEAVNSVSNPKDVAASVSARLLNYAREHEYAYQEVLQYYAIERFLYRLAQSTYRDTFVLKGGRCLFCLAPSPSPYHKRHRPTRQEAKYDRTSRRK